MDTEQKRADFEAWYLENNDVPREAIERKGDGYAWIGTDEAWEIWQAAQAALQESLDKSQDREISDEEVLSISLAVIAERLKDKEDAERYRCLSSMATQQADALGPIFRIDVRRTPQTLFNFDAAVDHARRAEGGWE